MSVPSGFNPVAYPSPAKPSASAVRDVWLELLTGVVSEEQVLVVLDRWGSSSHGYARLATAVADAVRAGDRRAEAAAWRQLECGAPYGFPAETALFMMRFNPFTGVRLDRYACLHTETESGPVTGC